MAHRVRPPEHLTARLSFHCSNTGMRSGHNPFDILILTLTALSAIGSLALRHCSGVREWVGHLAACAAMTEMAAPSPGLVGTLPWAVFLIGMAYWVTGSRTPIPDRLPVLCDLVCMAVLVVVMPLSMVGPPDLTRTGHEHGIARTAVDMSSLPSLVIITWGALRLALWWSGRRNPSFKQQRAIALTEAPMIAAMVLMVW